MKTFLNYLNSFFISFGKARAATELTRRGMYKQAQKLMSKE